MSTLKSLESPRQGDCWIGIGGSEPPGTNPARRLLLAGQRESREPRKAASIVRAARRARTSAIPALPWAWPIGCGHSVLVTHRSFAGQAGDGPPRLVGAVVVR